MSQSPWLTEFARKYGALTGQNRSGFTPDEGSIPYVGPSPFDIWDPTAHQRANLYGFTSEELQRLDCLPTRELKPSNLQNQILLIFGRETWDAGPLPDYDRDFFYPLENGNGLWDVSDDDIWNLLQPCLVLASRILISVHLLPWVRYVSFEPRSIYNIGEVSKPPKTFVSGNKYNNWATSEQLNSADYDSLMRC